MRSAPDTRVDLVVLSGFVRAWESPSRAPRAPRVEQRGISFSASSSIAILNASTIETPGGSRHEWLPTTAAVAPEIKLTEPAHVPEVGAGGFALA